MLLDVVGFECMSYLTLFYLFICFYSFSVKAKIDGDG